MSKTAFEGIRVTGLACAVPKRTELIKDYADRFDVERFIGSVGVEQRRVVDANQCSSDLCYVAAEKLIEHKKYQKDSFDAIILVTQTPDYLFPATSHVLQYRLGLPKDCIAFDINLACSGFIYGVFIASSMIKSGALNRVLLCCGDAQAHTFWMPQEDQSVAMMFGDAGTATIIERGDDVINTLLKADGSGYQVLMCPGLHSARVRIDYDHVWNEYKRICHMMDGPATFEFAIRREPESVKEFLESFGNTLDDYDYCVFHQANKFILEHTRKKLHLPKEKMPISIDRYGNTVGASIPLTIADMCPQLTKDTNRFLTSGFGAGLSWGVAGFSMTREDILPIIETEDYFKEAFTG